MALVSATGRTLHVDVPLSNVIVGRRPAGFIADAFVPVTPVDKQSNMYWKFQNGQQQRYEAGLTYRAPGTEARKVHMSVASDNYFCNNYALGTDWPVEDEVNADQMLNWATANATMVADRLLVDYEYRLANLAVTTSNVRTVTLVGCGWTNPNAPILTQMYQQIENFRQATGMMPNTMILPQNLLQYIAVNTQLRGIIFGLNGGVVTPEQLAGLLNIDQVLVPRSQVNTANEIDTVAGSGTFADIWGSVGASGTNTNVWIGYFKTLQGMYTDTWINAFRWTNPALGTPFAVERFPYDPRAKRYDLAVSYYQSEKVVSPDLCTRIIVNSN